LTGQDLGASLPLWGMAELVAEVSGSGNDTKKGHGGGEKSPAQFSCHVTEKFCNSGMITRC